MTDYARYQLAYHPENDADVVAWLNRQDNVTDAIRQLVRTHADPQRSLVAALREVVREELAQVTLARTEVTNTIPVSGDVDVDAGAVLDEMF